MTAYTAGGRGPGSRFACGVNAHGELDTEACCNASSHGGQLRDAAVITENIVRVQTDLSHIFGRPLVSIKGVDLLTNVLRQGDLGSGNGLRGVGYVRNAGVDLKVDMWPPARVTGREDRCERDLAIPIRHLNTAEIRFILDSAGVHRVGSRRIAMPHIHGSIRKGNIAIRHIKDGERQCHWHARSRAAATDARPNIATDNAGIFKDIRAIRPVTRVGPCRLIVDLGQGASRLRRRSFGSSA